MKKQQEIRCSEGKASAVSSLRAERERFEKCLLDFVRFNGRDVISTSGEDPVDGEKDPLGGIFGYDNFDGQGNYLG